MKKELKKRGRKPKEEYYSNKQADNVEIENRAIIIHLPISIEDCQKDDNLSHFSSILSGIPKELQGYAPESSTVFQEIDYEDPKEIVIGPVSHHPICTELEHISDSMNISTEVYDCQLIPDEIDKKSNMKTNICCFWCCHSFEQPPIFMPVSYDIKKQVFKVKGIFCSFNCTLAYMLGSNKYSQKKYLLHFMYKLFTGNTDFKDITPSPPRETLRMFGGQLHIQDYRRSFNHTTFIIQEYPISYIPTQIKKTSFLKKEQPKTKKINPIQVISPGNHVKVNNSLSKIIKTTC